MNYEIIIYKCSKFFLFLIFLFICISNRNKIKYILKKNRIINDILFINGCNQNLIPNSYFYRIVHQIEQLNAGNLESREIFYLNINPLMVCDFRIIIFFRCPWTKEINEAIALAKSLNKKVLFDIDNLDFEIKYTKFFFYSIFQRLKLMTKILF